MRNGLLPSPPSWTPRPPRSPRHAAWRPPPRATAAGQRPVLEIGAGTVQNPRHSPSNVELVLPSPTSPMTDSPAPTSRTGRRPADPPRARPRRAPDVQPTASPEPWSRRSRSVCTVRDQRTPRAHEVAHAVRERARTGIASGSTRRTSASAAADAGLAMQDRQRAPGAGSRDGLHPADRHGPALLAVGAAGRCRRAGAAVDPCPIGCRLPVGANDGLSRWPTSRTRLRAPASRQPAASGS